MRSLVCTSFETQLDITIPESLPTNAKEDDAFLQQLWSVIQDVHVIEGEMECPGCHRKFPITQGIPNMVRQKFRDDYSPSPSLQSNPFWSVPESF